MSNFERDVANAMLDKADERIRDLEAQLERSRSANAYDGNAHRRVSEIETELAISKGREEGKQLVINRLEAALKEAELQRDSWKRIAESGLGIPQTETKVCTCNLHNEPSAKEHASYCPQANRSVEQGRK